MDEKRNISFLEEMSIASLKHQRFGNFVISLEVENSYSKCVFFSLRFCQISVDPL